MLQYLKGTVVDDGARLASFADGSLDFVVANHMLEHAEDPIAALKHQLRVLKPGRRDPLPHAPRQTSSYASPSW
jgi:ubiquinone/menaquinone biosynthesis C-methylase UbiE